MYSLLFGKRHVVINGSKQGASYKGDEEESTGKMKQEEKSVEVICDRRVPAKLKGL